MKEETLGQTANKTTTFGRLRATDLEVGNEGNSVVDGHPANEEVILHVARVVIGQVDHQVNVTFTDQAVEVQESDKLFSLNPKN